MVNKIDSYEFKIPPEWKGIKEIEYFPEEEEENRIVRSIYLEGLEGIGKIVSVDVYEVDQQEIELNSWVNDLLIDFGLSGELKQEKIGDYNILSTIEKEHLAGAYIVFLHNNSKIYVFTGRSEDFTRYIISNGKW